MEWLKRKGGFSRLGEETGISLPETIAALALVGIRVRLMNNLEIAKHKNQP